MARSNAHNARINRNATASVENTSGNSELTDVPPRAHVLRPTLFSSLLLPPPLRIVFHRIPLREIEVTIMNFPLSLSFSLIKSRKKIFEEYIIIFARVGDVLLSIVENYRGVHNRVINAIDTRAFSKLPREGKIKMKGHFFLPFHGWSSRVISRSA